MLSRAVSIGLRNVGNHIQIWLIKESLYLLSQMVIVPDILDTRDDADTVRVGIIQRWGWDQAGAGFSLFIVGWRFGGFGYKLSVNGPVVFDVAVIFLFNLQLESLPVKAYKCAYVTSNSQFPSQVFKGFVLLQVSFRDAYVQVNPFLKILGEFEAVISFCGTGQFDHLGGRLSIFCAT